MFSLDAAWGHHAFGLGILHWLRQGVSARGVIGWSGAAEIIEPSLRLELPGWRLDRGGV